MNQIVMILVPDIGNYKDAAVIDIAVNEGDNIEINDTLITLETEKATIDVPADKAGKITAIKVKIGDKVSEGSVIVEMKTNEETEAEDKLNRKSEEIVKDNISNHLTTVEQQDSQEKEIIEILVPDIGHLKDVNVIDIPISVGDRVEVDTILMTLEAEKATIDVPADKAGIVKEIKIKIGDKVSEGDFILKLEIDSSDTRDKKNERSINIQHETNSGVNVVDDDVCSAIPNVAVSSMINTLTDEKYQRRAHAGPGVRKLARELGIDLLQVKGTAPHNRIVKEDIQNYISQQSKSKQNFDSYVSNSQDLVSWSDIDFQKFGPVEIQVLSRIKKISGKNLSRNWVMVPHVTQQDDADMTELEEFRQILNQEWEKEELKVSPLAFIIQASVKALQKFPEFNSSLKGEELIIKKYYHIGFAADTPNGLVVPVIKDVDKKGLKDIARELKVLSKKARDGKLSPLEMQGGSFTISSLGGIGGTYFTPIINVPEVAILGICKSQMKPVWNGQTFQPRLMCPLSLSYDHRVIDGALACRFITYLSKLLADYKRLLL
ncbi:MAG: dihydrolipoamide acetyltransferase [Neisseriaceae bacterium]|nr:MAG: dihydrolipoamide acetyltransferase [Neisseriaceae bacterium]